MEQLAVEWLLEQLESNIMWTDKAKYIIQQAKEMDKFHKTLLVEQLKEYTKEAQCILGNDEREASEFVDIFHQINFKSE
jgi:hypothetical protein